MTKKNDLPVILTESVEQSKDLIRMLYDLDVPVHIFPVIKTVPLYISEEIKAIYKNLSYFDWIVFSCMNDVRYFFFILLNQFLKFPSNILNIAAMGQETAKTLKTYGQAAEFLFPGFSFRELCQGFMKKHDVEGRKILVPTSETFNPHWLEPLEQAAEQVTILPIYHSLPVRVLPPQQILNLQEIEEAVVVLQTPLAVSAFMEFIPADSIAPSWKFVVKDDLTAAALSRFKTKADVVADTPEQEAVFKAVLQVLHIHP